jgi:hypothetical protein
MLSYITQLYYNPTDTIFWASAIAGTTLFALRMLMMLIGSSLEVEDADFDSFECSEDHYHAGKSFKLFSLHSLSGFFMMFGWVGLACHHQYNLSYANSCVIGFAVGAVLMVVIAGLMHAALMLQSPGAQFAIDETVGLTANVYQEIPVHGRGKIHVVVNGVTHELLAQSHNNRMIKSFTLVRVIKVIDQDTVEVIQN